MPSFGDSLSGLSNDDFLAGIFTASDFPTPAPACRAHSGRNTFRGPRYFNVDMSFIKSVKIPWAGGDSANVQFRIESFNLFNTTNLDLPIANLSDPLFGRSVSARAGPNCAVLGKTRFLAYNSIDTHEVPGRRILVFALVLSGSGHAAQGVSCGLQRHTTARCSRFSEATSRRRSPRSSRWWRGTRQPQGAQPARDRVDRSR